MTTNEWLVQNGKFNITPDFTQRFNVAFAFQVMTKRWTIPILNVFIFFRKVHILSNFLVARPFSQVHVDSWSLFNSYDSWESSQCKNVLPSFFSWNKQTGQVIVNDIAVCFLEIFLLFTWSPSLSFILLLSPVRREPELPVPKKDFCHSLLRVVQRISKSQVCVASDPMSHHVCWKLLLSESVTTSKVRRTLEQAVESIKFLILPALCAFLERFLLFPFFILYLEPY